MLSYQHVYHAGNPADVHKHAALAWMLDYLTQKDKPLSYIETHGGRGLYDLTGPEAARTGEAAAGIDRLLPRFPPDHPYARVIARIRAEAGGHAYPGSPLIARRLLRGTDTLHVAELHKGEYAHLRAALRGQGARLYPRDGLDLAASLCPPTPRRGLMLIDPSYEVKTDYASLPARIGKLARAWPVGIIALWFPVLKEAPHAPMLAALRRAHPGGLAHRVAFPPVRPGHRMTGSGLFVINPPWGLDTALDRIGAVFARDAG